MFSPKGLFLLTSILLYMLAVNDEVGHRPKPLENDDEPKFDYSYDWSMWHAVLSYFLVNSSAVMNVYLSQRRIKESDKEETNNEFGVAAMKKIVQLINITGRRPQDTQSSSSGNRMEMVEFTPITIL